MAITQISRIQLRRGKKISTTGIPQLASGEMAWAIDSQELYIGNGSVAEGAPYVGNTRILTEHEDLSLLISGQRFGAASPTVTLSVSRSIQSKLDDNVSAADFFVNNDVGDGVTDSTPSFQNALNQLFRNPDTRFRKPLFVPNGVYVFDSDLEIPSHTVIRGESRDGVIFRLGSSNLKVVGGSENRPQNIKISNITVDKNSTGYLDLTNVRGLEISNSKFVGTYTLDDPFESISTNAAVSWEDLSQINATDVSFENCEFDSIETAIRCLQETLDKNSVKITNCIFTNIDTAIYIKGVSQQTKIWNVENCKFINIPNYAVFSDQGRGILFNGCEFENCGNTVEGDPISTPIWFMESIDNSLINCRSDHIQEKSITELEGSVAISNVYNANRAEFINKNYAIITEFPSFRPLVIFGADNRSIKINYNLNLSTATRSGIVTITISDDLSKVNFSDQYTYSSTTGVDMTNFEFDVGIRDNDEDSVNETVILFYKNPSDGPTPTSSGYITFDVAYGV